MALQNAIAQHEMANLFQNLIDENDGPRFHAREDPFQLSDQQFINNFRLSKEQATRVINLVGRFTGEPSRSSALSANVQVSCLSRYNL